MDNKVLVVLYVPIIEKKYEVFLPANRRVGEICSMLAKGMVEISNNYYQITNKEHLYSRTTGVIYDEKQLLRSTNIRNGSELILM